MQPQLQADSRPSLCENNDVAYSQVCVTEANLAAQLGPTCSRSDSVGADFSSIALAYCTLNFSHCSGNQILLHYQQTVAHAMIGTEFDEKMTLYYYYICKGYCITLGLNKHEHSLWYKALNGSECRSTIIIS